MGTEIDSAISGQKLDESLGQVRYGGGSAEERRRGRLFLALPSSTAPSSAAGATQFNAPGDLISFSCVVAHREKHWRPTVAPFDQVIDVFDSLRIGRNPRLVPFAVAPVC
jgi:hypothetical protein